MNKLDKMRLEVFKSIYPYNTDNSMTVLQVADLARQVADRLLGIQNDEGLEVEEVEVEEVDNNGNVITSVQEEVSNNREEPSFHEDTVVPNFDNPPNFPQSHPFVYVDTSAGNTIPEDTQPTFDTEHINGPVDVPVQTAVEVVNNRNQVQVNEEEPQTMVVPNEMADMTRRVLEARGLIEPAPVNPLEATVQTSISQPIPEPVNQLSTAVPQEEEFDREAFINKVMTQQQTTPVEEGGSIF